MAGAVFVNNKQCRKTAFELQKNSRVFVQLDTEKLFFEKTPNDIDFVLSDSDVLFFDDSLIVINKPPFIPTEDTIVATRKSVHSALIKYLWEKNPELKNPPYCGIMHRLDRETSGCLLFTLTRSVNPKIHDLFENHAVKKMYRAVCALPKNNHFVVGQTFSTEFFMGRTSAKSAKCKMGKIAQNTGGVYSRTDFCISGINKNFAYIDCFPKTGRTHQIRLHLSSMGLPIVGDELYGSKVSLAEYNNRIMLHSALLEFIHPKTDSLISIKSPLPNGFF